MLSPNTLTRRASFHHPTMDTVWSVKEKKGESESPYPQIIAALHPIHGLLSKRRASFSAVGGVFPTKDNLLDDTVCKTKMVSRL